MHDLEFEHLHVSAEDGAVNEVAWAADNVELTTVGIDIGSSTSHLMFARVHLQRLSAALRARGPGLEEAALTCATPLRVLRHVTLPIADLTISRPPGASARCFSILRSACAGAAAASIPAATPAAKAIRLLPLPVIVPCPPFACP